MTRVRLLPVQPTRRGPARVTRPVAPPARVAQPPIASLSQRRAEPSFEAPLVA